MRDIGRRDSVFDRLVDCLKLCPFVQVTQLPSNFPGKPKIKVWVGKLNQMAASHELDESEQRQLLFDLESSYNEFMASV